MTTITRTQALDKARELYEAEFGPSLPTPTCSPSTHPDARRSRAIDTDHEGGHVIAGALDVSVDGIAVANGTNTVRIGRRGVSHVQHRARRP